MLALLTLGVALAQEPNPPKWPSSVSVFGPGDSNIEDVANAAFASNGGHNPPNHGQFSEKRFAFLFKPGTYDVNIPVGYYTQVLGLGATPSDVTFTGARGVFSEEGDYSIGGALSTFWRSAENFKSSAFNKWNVGTGMMWAVSQAAPLRRIEVDNELLLFEYQPPITEAGEASGGYCSNMKVGGHVKPGSQQQWFSRDSTIGGWENGVWNMVFTGVDGAMETHCGNDGGAPITNVDKTPLIAEKPFITIGTDGKYSIAVPPVKTNSHGADHTAVSNLIGFDKVYVTQPSDGAAQINAKLAAGLSIVVSPGIYKIDSPLVVAHEGQIILGLGLATLISSNQNVIIQVNDVDNVRIAGLLLQAGAPSTDIAPALLVWGEGKGYQGDATKPGVLSDVFARVGGPDGTSSSPVGVKIMFHLQNGHTIIDNTWMWRADHVEGGPVTFGSNRCDTGLVVDGDNVITYGLAVEHTEQDLTQWNGNNGQTFFYQSELPYGANQAQFGDPGYCGFRVAPDVTKFNGYGIGVYSFFRDHNVTVASGIVAPKSLESSFVAPMTVFLNGYGSINHILNGRGDPAEKAGTAQYLCDNQ